VRRKSRTRLSDELGVPAGTIRRLRDGLVGVVGKELGHDPVGPLRRRSIRPTSINVIDERSSRTASASGKPFPSRLRRPKGRHGRCSEVVKVFMQQTAGRSVSRETGKSFESISTDVKRPCAGAARSKGATCDMSNRIASTNISLCRVRNALHPSATIGHTGPESDLRPTECGDSQGAEA